MENHWQKKIEQEINELTISINKLATHLENFILHSKEIQEVKFKQIESQLSDHEQRIRHNTKFAYQAVAALSALSMGFNILMKFI